jgi:tetratricopeptide (TPR) repeat protein
VGRSRPAERCAVHALAVLAVAALAAAALHTPPAAAAAPDLARADSLRLTGHYAEARAAYTALATREPAAAARGIARCMSAAGDREGAIAALSAAAAKHPAGEAALEAELAELEFERGGRDAAQRHVDRALELDPDRCAARYLAAELHEAAGRLPEAEEAYRWLVHDYNRARDSITDPEDLLWIGRGAAQYARWNRNSGQFSFLVNTLYPRCRRLDPRFWPSHLEAARLFIEKYNPVDAGAELDSALAINPNAAELHVARAQIALDQGAFDAARQALDRALALDPNSQEACRTEADLVMSAFGPARALPSLERARKLDPLDEETLGRLAAVYGAVDGLDDTLPGTRMRRVIDDVVRRNEHCGTFYAALASALDRMFKFPHAARAYEEARRRMPQLATVPGQLGMVWMRLGEESRAAEQLEDAFQADPFNARVKNTLEVLDLLKEYDTIETAHFLVRHDRGRDSLLARYAARYLEDEVYPAITGRLGFAPPGKSLIEIFSTARGTDAHAWFSARMAGLPFIGTVAACAGKIVAMASPTDLPGQFAWARVLRHEYVHVVNLQQTGFNIPRWYTEGLAVYHEDSPRLPEWDVILARRADAGTLFTLENINLGFTRPANGDDWPLAYCQALLYVSYFAEAYGKDANARLIAAYADNLDTPRALVRAFGVPVEQLEAGYRKYVERVAAGVNPVERSSPRRPAAGVKDPDALAQLADASLEAGARARARELAAQALALRPRQPLASYVMARLSVATGEKEAAWKMLKEAVDLAAPEPKSLAMLADLARERGDLAEAERLARAGADAFPHSSVWPRALGLVFEATRDTSKLALALLRLCDMEESDAGARERLARLAEARGDPKEAGRWATRALQVDVMNAEAHGILAGSLSAAGRFEPAVQEYETAIRLGSKQQTWLLGLARACARTGRSERAREALRDLLETDPEYPGARELLDTLH